MTHTYIHIDIYLPVKCATLERVLFAGDTCRRSDSDALVV